MGNSIEAVRLPDGTRAVIRPIREDGAERLAQAIRELSPTSRYQRFLSAREYYPPEQLERFVRCDGVTSIGIVFVPLDANGEELEPVGVAHCLRESPDSDCGEIAIAVSDDWQGRGVGSALAESLAHRSHAVGVRRWWAFMLAENRPARQLMLRFGVVETECISGGRIEMTTVLNPVNPS